MRGRSNPPSPVSDLVGRVLQRIDPERKLDAYRVWLFWNEEVGEAIAARAQPSGYHRGVLSVRVSSHSWMQELQLMKDALRERLNARLGQDLIRDIYFTIAPQADDERPRKTRR